jgi:hypothetical protein
VTFATEFTGEMAGIRAVPAFSGSFDCAIAKGAIASLRMTASWIRTFDLLPLAGAGCGGAACDLLQLRHSAARRAMPERLGPVGAGGVEDGEEGFRGGGVSFRHIFASMKRKIGLFLSRVKWEFRVRRNGDSVTPRYGE